MPEQPSRIVAVHQYAVPLALMAMGLSTMILSIAGGWALIAGTLEAASFVAVVGQIVGLAGTIAGVSSAKRETRAGDTPTGTGNGAATATVTVASGGTGGGVTP